MITFPDSPFSNFFPETRPRISDVPIWKRNRCLFLIIQSVEFVIEIFARIRLDDCKQSGVARTVPRVISDDFTWERFSAARSPVKTVSVAPPWVWIPRILVLIPDGRISISSPFWAEPFWTVPVTTVPNPVFEKTRSTFSRNCKEEDLD